MTINRTTLLDLPLPVTGTESGVWGDVTNNGLTQYLDIAIAGRNALTSANFTGGALTLATTEGDSSATNIAAGSAQYATLYVSSLAANSTITAPSSNRAYRVVNADATYTLTVKAAGQTGVVFPVNTSGTVVFNGTDYVLLGSYVIASAGTASLPSITFTGDTNTGIFSPAADTIAFAEGGVEAMRIDSSGRTLIGSTSARENLFNSTVTASFQVEGTDSNNSNVLVARNSNDTTGAIVALVKSRGGSVGSNTVVQSGDNVGLISFQGSDGTEFVEAARIQVAVDGTPGANDMPGRIEFRTTADGGTSTTERMRIDSSGNVGIGTAGAPLSKLDVAVEATLTRRFLVNYDDSVVTIKSGNNSANPEAIRVVGDNIRFNTGTSGSGSERARIDSSGRLLVGTTAQGTYGGNTAEFRGANIATPGSNVTGNLTLFTTDSQAADVGAIISLGGVYDATTPYAFGAIAARKSNSTSGNAQGYLQFYTTSLSNVISEKARITSGGDLAVGTTTAEARLTVGGDVATAASSTICRIGTADYTTNTVLSVAPGVVNFDAAGTVGGRFHISSGGEVRIAGTTDQGAFNLQVQGTGVWGAGAYVNGSDERIKEDIAPIASGLYVVEKLNPVTYRYKETWTKDQSVQTGFIAQELLTALEGQVYVDGVVQQGGEKGYYSVAYQNIIPILTKAIQELKAELDTVKAELATLKG